MNKYFFYDTDIYENEEYDIRGQDYENLIRTCCRYSAVLYLKYLEPNLQLYDKLKKFEITKPQNIPDDPSRYSPYCKKRYYTVCPELCSILLSSANGIFEWTSMWYLKHPDDPIFYRNDGTAFFASDIHNGSCAIMPREDENIEESGL